MVEGLGLPEVEAVGGVARVEGPHVQDAEVLVFVAVIESVGVSHPLWGQISQENVGFYPYTTNRIKSNRLLSKITLGYVNYSPNMSLQNDILSAPRIMSEYIRYVGSRDKWPNGHFVSGFHTEHLID